MERRRKIILAVVILLLLLLAALLALFLFFRSTPVPPGGGAVETNVNQPPAGQLDTSVVTNVNAAVPPVGEKPATPAVAPDERNNLKSLAKSFAERYGSFSNTSNFENLLDLKVFMSHALAVWADRYAAEARAEGVGSAEYSGTTTRAISNDLISFDEAAGTAEVRVKTQRREATATGESVYYQDISIKFIKESGAWKVNAAEWQPKG